LKTGLRDSSTPAISEPVTPTSAIPNEEGNPSAKRSREVSSSLFPSSKLFVRTDEPGVRNLPEDKALIADFAELTKKDPLKFSPLFPPEEDDMASELHQQRSKQRGKRTENQVRDIYPQKEKKGGGTDAELHV
jgi:hypothetical protein